MRIPATRDNDLWVSSVGYGNKLIRSASIVRNVSKILSLQIEVPMFSTRALEGFLLKRGWTLEITTL